MKTYLNFSLLLLLFVAPTPFAIGQSQTYNTSIVSLCSCSGALWNTITPYQPSITFGAPGPSKKLMFTNYGFSIPATASVTGVQVDFTYTTTNTTSTSLRDTAIVLLSGGFQIGLTKEASTGYYNGTNSITLGGPGDTWSWNLTPAMINLPDFGFNFKLISNDVGSHLEFVNGASITVYYTLPNGLKESQSSRANANLRVEQKQLLVSSGFNESADIAIYSILGNKLLQFTLDEQSKKEIDLSSFTNGIYIYTVKTKSAERSGKFILN